MLVRLSSLVYSAIILHAIEQFFQKINRETLDARNRMCDILYKCIIKFEKTCK